MKISNNHNRVPPINGTQPSSKLFARKLDSNNLPNFLNQEKRRVIGLYNPNLREGKRVLFAFKELATHVDFAKRLSLYNPSTDNLKEGWFCFQIIFLPSLAVILPRSDYLGSIPSKFLDQFKKDIMGSIDLPGYQINFAET